MKINKEHLPVLECKAGHMWLVNLDSLARYFEQGDPVPAEPGQTVHGIRQQCG